MNDLDKQCLILNTAATWYMVGLIWFVQLVHYPLFDGVGEKQFPDYAKRHQYWTTLAVGPPMLVEAATAVLLAFRLKNPLCWLGLVLLGIIWASTALLQVPRHEELSTGFQSKPYLFLVWSNWIRTIAWTLRGVLTMTLIHLAMQPSSE
ncbi:MAG: hypothetical protein ACKO23_19855 [Gemmataceae bacterium]